MSPLLRPALLLLTLALAAAGCEKKESAPPPRTVTPPRVSTKQAGSAESQSPCLALEREFRALLKTAKGSCEKDADCFCYPAVVDCGGVTDRLSWGRLQTLVRMFRLARCKPPAGCSVAPCQPQCVAGRCRASAQASR